MTKRRWIEAGAYLAGAAILLYTWFALVPGGVLSDPWNPAHFSAISAVAGVAGVVLFRVFLAGRAQLERLLMASFLVFMALIYLWAALVQGTSKDVVVECVGLLVFGAVAVVGYRRSLLILAFGIAAHGMLWDAWHHGYAAYIADWYPLGCAAFDIAFGLMIVAYVWASDRPGPAGA